MKVPTKDMSIAVNGRSQVPPGFRFHPTEEELINYYLRKKVACENIDLDVIRDVDLNKLEPWDIQEKCRIGSAPQNDWYFFSHKDKKYPTGTRTNRATAAGFWKATGRDKVIHTSSKRIGMRKTLVFYKGRAPHGQKSDWIMHEYRIDDHQQDANSQLSNVCDSIGDLMSQEDGWVVCRVFKKKNFLKSLDNNNNNNSSSITSDDGKLKILQPNGDKSLDQLLQYMGRSCKKEKNPNTINMNGGHLFPMETNMSMDDLIHETCMKLPALESPLDDTDYGIGDWAALDRLIASHLDGSPTDVDVDANSIFLSTSTAATNNNNNSEMDLWAITTLPRE